jgi:hypothetical protein
MQAFSRLLKTDWRNMRGVIWGAAGMIVLLQLFSLFSLFFNTNLYFDVCMEVVNAVCIVAALTVPFVNSFTIWAIEWNSRSHYVLFSLPVPRASIMFSKFLTVLLHYLLLACVTLAGMWLQFSRVQQTGQMELAWLQQLNGGKPFVLFAGMLICLVTLIAVCFMLVLLGKAEKGSGKLIGSILFLLVLICYVFLAFLTLGHLAEYSQIPASEPAQEIKRLFGIADTNGMVLFYLTANLALAVSCFLAGGYLLRNRIQL